MKLIDRYSLKYVTFPVFQIPDEVRLEDGLLLYNNKVIDDLNQPASTLGTRRLQTPHAKYRMRKLFRNLIDLIKNNYTGKLIDSKGLVFKYRKNSFEKVVSHKIKSIVKSDGLCTMTLIGVNFPIRLNAPPPPGCSWANVLYLEEHPWLVYSFSEGEQEVSKRKV